MVLSSCVSRPEPVDTNYASLLYNEQGIFLQVKPNKNLTLANKMLSAVGMDPKALETVLERTHTAYCYFDFKVDELQNESVDAKMNDGVPESEPDRLTYSIIGQGRYPETIAALSLNTRSGWENKSSSIQGNAEVRWWSNTVNGVKLSFIQDNTVCITNGKMEALLHRIYNGPVKPLPKDGSKMLESGVLGVYSFQPDFGDFVSTAGTMSGLFSRLEEISMTFKPNNESIFLIDAEYVCESEAMAGSFYLMLRLALLSGINSLKGQYDLSTLLEEDPVLLKGSRIVLRNYPISIERIDWFFQQALPYVQVEE